MSQQTDRYSATEFDYVHANWRIGVGRDVRLNRTVVLAVTPRSKVNDEDVKEWLMRRSTFSHPYVAQLFDVAYTDEEMICVFEGTETAHLGLPNLDASLLLSTFLQIAEGMEALYHSGQSISFSVGEIIFDGKRPKLLGLIRGRNEVVETESSLARQLAQYFGRALEWIVVSLQNPLHHPLSPIWQAGLDRLLSFDEADAVGFGDVQTVIGALMVQEDMIQASEGDPVPAAVDRLTELTGLPDKDFDDTEDYAFADEFETKRHPIGKMVAWSSIVLGLVVIVLVGGDLILQTQQNSSSSHPLPPMSTTPSTSVKQKASGNKSQGSGGAPASAHARTIVIPHLTGLAPVQAIQRLTSLSIPSSKIRVLKTSVSGASGTIVRASPSFGSAYQKGESVILYATVGAGQELVPNLLNLSLQKAQTLLSNGSIHYSYRLKPAKGVTKGTVFAQYPAPYSVQSSSSSVQFDVAASY